MQTRSRLQSSKSVSAFTKKNAHTPNNKPASLHSPRATNRKRKARRTRDLKAKSVKVANDVEKTATGDAEDIKPRGDPPPKPASFPAWLLENVCSFFAMPTTMRAVITRNLPPAKVRQMQRQAIRLAVTNKHWYSALKSHHDFFSHICLRGLWCGASDELLISLADKHRKTLRSCDLEGCHTLTDASMLELSKCPKLHTLVLSLCRFNPPPTTPWPTNLVHLVMKDCNELDRSRLQCILKQNSTLRSLCLAYCPQVGDEALDAVALFCPKLLRLDVQFCLQVGDSGIISVAYACTQLRVVLLNGCENLSDDSLEVLLEKCSCLRHVTVSRTTSKRVTMDMVSRLRSIGSSPSQPKGSVLCEGDTLYEEHFGSTAKPKRGKKTTAERKLEKMDKYRAFRATHAARQDR